MPYAYDELKAVLLAAKSDKAKRQAYVFFTEMDKHDKLQSGMMADLGNRFQLFLDDEAVKATSYNTIDFRTMTERPIALFLQIPARMASLCRPLFSVFIMQMWNEWEARAEEEPNGKLPFKIECYMDEFANVGHIPDFENHYTTMRDLGIGLLLVIQAHEQLSKLYGDQLRKVFLTNCGTHVLLPGGGLEECEYYSKRIGDTTVQSTSHTVKGGGLFGGGEHSMTTSEKTRPLYTVGELRVIPEGQMLMMPAQLAPLMLKIVPYYEDREVRERADLPYAHVTVRQEPATSTPPTRPNSRPTTPSSGPTMGTWGKTPPRPTQLPPWQRGGNTGRVVNSNPDDDDSWPPYAPE